jgi:hypothetical protein
MDDHRTPPVPPNSTACRELLRVVGDALTLPYPATHADEVSYFRLRSQRATQALVGIRRVVDNKEADNDDMMTEAQILRVAIADLPPDCYEHSGLAT